MIFIQTKIKFNLSASSLATYNDSQVQFYFQYILKSKPDTEVNSTYGDAGSVVHSCAEKFIQNRNDTNAFLEIKPNSKITDYNKYYKLFLEKWKDYKLDYLNGFNGLPLNINDYKQALDNTLNYINDREDITIAEKNFLFPLINNNNAEINIKGFIDAIDPVNHIIFDWKTNSSITNFQNHAKMYCYAYYKLYNKLPKAIYYYCKLDKVQQYEFSLEEILEFEKYIKNIVLEILNKGFDISKYSLGNFEGSFNSHYKKCLKESMKRKNTKIIDIAIKNNRLFFNDSLPNDIRDILVEKYKYRVAGCEFSELYKTRKWDGYKRFFSYNSIPLGFIHDFKRLIKEYNEYFNMNIHLNFIDERDALIINKTYDTKFKENDYTLYDFQEDCVTKAIESEIGIVFVGTGGGKTLISSEIIRRLNRKSLYLVNRIELGEQVRDNLEEMLGVDIGLMSEGKIVIDKQITVASIQTLGAILKRTDKTRLELRKYLSTISLVICDEAQNIKDIGYYGMLRKTLVNCKYIIGMTGTPFRSS